VASRDEALGSFAKMVARATPVEDEWIIPLISYSEDEAGGLYYVPLFGRKQQIIVRANEDLHNVTSWLRSQKAILERFTTRDLEDEVLKALALCVIDKGKSTGDTIREVRKKLAGPLPPTCVVIPVHGVAVDRVYELELALVGPMGDEFENAVDSKSQQLGLNGFAFSDDALWTEFLMAKRRDHSLRDEFDPTEGLPLICCWTSEQGRMAFGPAVRRAELLLAFVQHAARWAHISSPYVPHILTNQAYQVEYQSVREDDDRIDSLYNEIEFLQVPDYRGRSPLFLHKGDPIDIGAVFADSATLELANYVLGAMRDNSTDVQRRLARHIEWAYTGDIALAGVDRWTLSSSGRAIVAYVTALEALLGGGHADIAERIAERVALLAPTGDRKDRYQLYRTVKRLYDLRSRLVHGSESLLDLRDDVWENATRLSGHVRTIGSWFLKVSTEQSWHSEEDIAAWFDERRFGLGV